MFYILVNIVKEMNLEDFNELVKNLIKYLFDNGFRIVLENWWFLFMSE